MSPTSDPAHGSVIAKQINFLPKTQSLTYFSKYKFILYPTQYINKFTLQVI